jgi:hypothetical protein
MSDMADEIASLSAKRVAAVARERELSKVGRARLQQLLSAFGGEVARLRLRADRVSDLVAALDDERRALAQAERDFARPDHGDVADLRAGLRPRRAASGCRSRSFARRGRRGHRRAEMGAAARRWCGAFAAGGRDVAVCRNGAMGPLI